MRKGGVAAENPFASPDDGEEQIPILAFEPDFPGRSMSLASSHQFARTGSVRFGDGPSHPYGMYPQGTMPRSPSIATQSTARVAHRHSNSLRRNGPQHPYALYPQGVSEDIDIDDDEEDDDMAPNNPVPVGFPGLGQSYQRRLGPDGEEQDIVGMYGHTEQLPPYSRYPEDGPEKVPLLAPEAPSALHSRAPVAGSDPTMDLMHTHIQPQPTQHPQSMTDASNLRAGRPHSMASMERMHSNSPEDSVLSNKSWKEKSWQEKRKTKFCGVPFWLILLAAFVLGFIAAVIGGVLGGFFSRWKHHAKPLNMSSTSLYDASAIATPVTATPPTGTYVISLSTPQETQAACLVESNQAAAWSCDLAGGPGEAIAVSIPPDTSQLGAFIFYASDNHQICYGTQMSFMETTFAPFITVQDNDDPQSGPAYYFSQFYDKLVVVPENALSTPSSSKSKRQIHLDGNWLQQKQVAQAGDRPWFCIWNNTFVEGFIFVERHVVETVAITATTPKPTANLSTSTSSSAPPAATANSAGPTSSVSYLTTTVTVASATVTYNGPASAYPGWAAEQQASHSSAVPNKNGDMAKTWGRKGKRQNMNGLYESLQLYPYVVKIEERRLPGNTVSPYCQQYQILNDGSYNWVPDANGNPIIINLSEQDPGYGAYQSAGIAGTKKEKRQDVVGGCHCQWSSGQSI